MYWKYLKVVLKHKWFVFLECCKLGIPWLGVIHDLSKFLPSEFIPYSRNFYGSWGKDDKPWWVQNDFDLAWLHHQHRNKHHWQRWLLTLDSARSDGKMIPMRMPIRYAKEMLADWKGAGRAYGSKQTTAEWYLQHRDEMHLNGSTQYWIEIELGIA